MFNRVLIDALHDIVPAVKPQIAFYEQYGPPGLSAYKLTLEYAREKGMITIGDIKRGDIAATGEAYADGHLGRVRTHPEDEGHVVFDSDFVTINPYMGYDAVEPFINTSNKYGKGMFVLVCTSNENAAAVQGLETNRGKVYEAVGRLVSEWGADFIGEEGYSSVGAVVGATTPVQASSLRKQMPHTFFLVPGYGAQGGTASGAAAAFDEKGGGAIVNNSRGIIAAHVGKDDAFPLSARKAAIKMRDELRAELPGY
jgi:orotidine-5'-phosphate decarboxylase